MTGWLARLRSFVRGVREPERAEKYKELGREVRGLAWFSSMALDFKVGWRMLLKFPGLTIVGGLGIAVAVAIGTGFFIVLDTFVDPTLPLAEGDRIVVLENLDVVSSENLRSSPHDFLQWRALTSVQQLAAFRTSQARLVTGMALPRRVEVAEMTAAAFTIARVPPLLGRYLDDADERPGAPAVAVIGYEVWQRSFAADPNVIGRQVLLGDTGHAVVGVMPRGFAFPKYHDVWIALRDDPLRSEPGVGLHLYIIGRLAPGATMEQAQAELTALGQRLAASFPATHRQLRPHILRYTRALDHIEDSEVWQYRMIGYMASLLLLAVAINVAVLVYARTAMRRGELALRTAIGAGRRRIVLQLFVEAFVLSTVSAAVGLLITQLTLQRVQRFIEQNMKELGFWTDWGLRPSTVLYALGLAVVAAVIVGVIPALQSTGRQLQSDLRQLGGGTGMRLGRLWSMLIVTQVAVAVAVLPLALNIAWSELRGIGSRPTYPAHEFLVASVGLVGEVRAGVDAEAYRRDTQARFGDRITELMRRIEADPAVVDLTFDARLAERGGLVQIEGVDAPPESPAGHWIGSVGGDTSYLRVFGARLLAGRFFQSADLAESGTAVIVNRTFAQRLLGGSALGRRVRHVETSSAEVSERKTSRWYEVVGVVEDLAVNPMDPASVQPVLYYPVSAAQVQQAALLIHLRGNDPEAFAPTVRKLTTAVDPGLKIVAIDAMGLPRSWWRLLLAFLGIAEGVAPAIRAMVLGLITVLGSVLLLSAAGIHALMSFTVTQRHKEIAIRAALGARPRRVLRGVLLRASGQLLLGAALGSWLGAALLNQSATTGRIAVILLLVTSLMFAAGMLATLGPARRGLRIQPMDALKHE